MIHLDIDKLTASLGAVIKAEIINDPERRSEMRDILMEWVDDIDRRNREDRANLPVQYAWGWPDRETVHGSFDTVESAIADARQVAEGTDIGMKTVWVGPIEHFEINAKSIGDTVVEQLECDAFDFAGEYADSWPFLDAEQIEGLGNVIIGEINAVADNDPSFWRVTYEKGTIYNLKTGEKADITDL